MSSWKDYSFGNAQIEVSHNGRSQFSTRTSRMISILMLVAICSYSISETLCFANQKNRTLSIEVQSDLESRNVTEWKLFDMLHHYAWHYLTLQEPARMIAHGIICENIYDEDLKHNIIVHCEQSCDFTEKRYYDDYFGGPQNCIWETPNGLLGITGVEIDTSGLEGEDLIAATNMCNNGYFGYIALTSITPAENEDGYVRKQMEQAFLTRLGLVDWFQIQMEEIHIKRISKWSMFNFDVIENEEKKFHIVNNLHATVSISDLLEIYDDSDDFSGCAFAIAFEVLNRRQVVKVYPESILTLLGKIGGFATFVLGLRIILSHYNKRKVKNFNFELSSFAKVERLTQAERRIEVLEKELCRLLDSPVSDEFPQKDLFFVPM